MTKFKAGDKIKMKESCSSLWECVKRGEICTLHMGFRTGSHEDTLVAWGRNNECACQDKWQLIKPKKKSKKLKWTPGTSMGKVCKHKYPNGMSAREIHNTNKYSHQEFGIKHFEQALVVVCKLCLEKKYI